MRESLFNSYSMPLLHLNTYIINDQLIKNRAGDLEDEIDIDEKIKNFDNIAIQTGRKLDIYCDELRSQVIMTHIERDENSLSKAWKDGLVTINTI